MQNENSNKFYIILKGEITVMTKNEEPLDLKTNYHLKRQNYIARHRVRENWNKSGIHTAGFWSRWILWNKPTLQESINDVEKRFNIKIINKT